MATDASAVLVGVTGAVFFAPESTAVPTTVSEALAAAFLDVGYITEDGVVTSVTTETADIKAWQNGDTVRRVQTSHDFTVAFTMLETNEKSLELFYGNFTHGVLGVAGKVEINSGQPYRGAFVLNVVDDDDLIRVVIPDGQITERGEVSYVNGGAATYPVTLTCYPDSAGVKAVIYFETDDAS